MGDLTRGSSAEIIDVERRISIGSGIRPSFETPRNVEEVAIQLDTPESQLTNIETIPEHKRIFIEINDVNAFVPNLFGPKRTVRQRLSSIVHPGDESKQKPMNQVLFDTNGSVEPGEVLALMGPSGSGKTTLLSIIGGRAQRAMRVKGNVLFNGSRLGKKTKRLMGFVAQDDLLYEDLTVHETLYFAAMLRLPRTMTKAQKVERVDAVITALGLQHCKNTIIGGFFKRGISGGERKRTSVGHELLIDPSCLLLDEPTSGLDSTTAMHLMEVLRALAHGGRTIVTTIHQPSSRLYQQLDKLMLLSKGKTLYFGRAQQAVDYFDVLGYPIPSRVNAADFLLDLASGEVPSKERDGPASTKYLLECTATYLGEHPMEGFDLDRDGSSLQEVCIKAHKGGKLGNGNLPTIPSSATFVDGAAASPNGRASPFDHAKFRHTSSKYLPMDVSMKRPHEEEDDRWGASYMQQINILFVRSIRTRRFQSLSGQDIIQYLTIAILAGLFWFQKGRDDTLVAARNIQGLLFFELMFLSFRALFVALFTFPDEQKMMLKERASGMYRLSAFYIARTASDLPMDFAIPTAFLIIVYFMGGLRHSAAAFFANYGTVILSMFVAQSLGLLLGSIAMNPKSAQTIAAVLMLTIILTAGFFATDLAAWISWLRWLSYVYYSLGILLFIEFDGGNRTIYSCTEVTNSANTCVQTNPDDPQSQPNCSPVTDLQDALGLLQDPSSQTDALYGAFVLVGFLVLLRVAVYVVLRRKTASL